ncbi:MAG TPA: hypothetical protein VLH16_06090 [Bacteroidales bacterium]|nr:hypothetical protein [Bacteroidales bacterium]
MQNNYMCPKCKGYLNVGNSVILSVTSKNNQRGIVLLSSEIGDYTTKHHSSLHFAEGEKVSFYCPICHARLASRRHTNLARILMVDENNDVFEVLFSEITGERCTFQIMGNQFKVFGDDSQYYKEFLESMRKGHSFRNL